MISRDVIFSETNEYVKLKENNDPVVTIKCETDKNEILNPMENDSMSENSFLNYESAIDVT